MMMTINTVTSTTFLILCLSLKASSFSFAPANKARPLHPAEATVRHSTASSSTEVGQTDAFDEVNVDVSAWANGFSNCEEEAGI